MPSKSRIRPLAKVSRTSIFWNLLLKEYRDRFTLNESFVCLCVSDNHCSNGNIWKINEYGIQKLLKRLGQDTRIKCNPHSFRRGFASNLHRKGLSTLDIMHLGGWQDLSMVLRYTRSITFDDCLEHYRKATS